jgi:hypothetical protein
MDEKLLNKIISAAYEDGSMIGKRKIKKIIRTDPEAERIYTSFKEVADKVHDLPERKCPDEVLWRAEEKIDLTEVRRSSFLKPAAAFAVILIAAVVALFSLINKEKQTYSHQEILAAEVQAKESLALVSRILNKTTSTLGNDILPDKVSKPVKKGLNIINNLFIGG